jgi:deazaflavin-dependent oxidoreductase (nitroreductase family)
MNRLGNRIIGFLLRLGVPFGPMALLTVVGRKSGRPRSTPIAVLAHDDGWRLLATYGIGDWVRNLRAAGTATLTLRGARIPVSATEVDRTEAAPFIHATVASAGRITRKIITPHFTASVDDPIEAWEDEATRHPMFQLTPLQLPQVRGRPILTALTVLLILGVLTQIALAGLGGFRQPGAYDWHGTMGVVTEAVALAAALVAIALRRVGVRWLTVAIFTLITFQHGTATIGGLAGGIHATNSLLMLLAASIILRRLRLHVPLPAAPRAATPSADSSQIRERPKV